MISGGEAGRRGALGKGHIHFGLFWAVKGLIREQCGLMLYEINVVLPWNKVLTL